MSCFESRNLLCKHVRAVRTYYMDLDDYLPPGVTLVPDSLTADSEDPLLSVDAVAIVETDTVIEANANCDELTLRAGRAVLILLSGGTPTDPGEEAVVTISWEQSDGDEDSMGGRLTIGGVATPSP